MKKKRGRPRKIKWEDIELPRGETVSRPDILDKLTNPIWRKRLEKICYSFENSHNPKYKEMVWLGDCNLSTACDWLEVTNVG